jgi:hypothetical protein
LVVVVVEVLVVTMGARLSVMVRVVVALFAPTAVSV